MSILSDEERAALIEASRPTGSVMITANEAEQLRAETTETVTKLAESIRPAIEAGRAVAAMHDTKPELFDDGNSAVRAMIEWYQPSKTGNHSNKIMTAGFAFSWKKHAPIIAGAGGVLALAYKVFDKLWGLLDMGFQHIIHRGH